MSASENPEFLPVGKSDSADIAQAAALWAWPADAPGGVPPAGHPGYCALDPVIVFA